MIGSKSVEHVKRYYVDQTLVPAMGLVEVRALTTEHIQAWILERKSHNYSNSAINKCLACLNRALVLAERNGTIQRRPYVPLLKADPPREGFYSDEEWARLKAALQTPERAHVLPVLETARLTGCRISELIGSHGLQWRNVNLDEGWIRLEGGSTKNGDGRTLPILPALMPILTSLRVSTEGKISTLSPWVFTYRGQPIRSIRTAFRNACVEAGVRRTLHDFRRTFRRYLALAGIGDKVGQAMMGHKDLKTYYAYMPVIDADKQAAAQELQKVVSQ